MTHIIFGQYLSYTNGIIIARRTNNQFSIAIHGIAKIWQSDNGSICHFIGPEENKLPWKCIERVINDLIILHALNASAQMYANPKYAFLLPKWLPCDLRAVMGTDGVKYCRIKFVFINITDKYSPYQKMFKVERVHHNNILYFLLCINLCMISPFHSKEKFDLGKI